jgi:HK97 family phage major capsid protein
MLRSHIKALRDAERRAETAIASVMRKSANFSLIELIRDKTRDYIGPRDTQSMHTHFDLDRECAKLAGAANGTWVPFQALTRDLTTSNSGAILGSGMQSSIVPALAPVSAVIGAGATVLNVTASDVIRLPAIDQPVDPSGAWIPEGGTYATAEPQFRQIEIQPRTLAVKLFISRRLLMSATPDVEREVRRHLLEALMGELDRVAIAGSGIGNEPVGLLNNPDIPVVEAGPDGAAPTWDHVTQLEFEVASRSGDITSGAFLTNAAVLRKLRRTRRGSGLDYIMADSTTLLGHPVRVSERVPNNLTKGTGTNLSAIIFGSWSDFLVVFWGPQAVDVMVDSVTKAKDGLVVVTARVDVGFAPLHPGSFAIMKDVSTA